MSSSGSRGRISRVGTIAGGADLAYRPEIDGLRAVAVAAVVLYHAGIGGAGFVGVDIFFVISGYLITSLLLREIEATGRIDMASFYARRARRILPAAFLVIAVVCVVSAALLGPYQAAEVDRSAAAALVFLANFHFQSVTGGYFDASADQMPLLHLWSLSVEEQYYLVWPIVLGLLASRGHRRVIVGATALGVLSIGMAQLWLASDPEAAFFQMPSRFWELATGAVIAASSPAVRVRRCIHAVGMALLLASIVFRMPTFPGLGAAPAVAGAGLVILHLHRGGSDAFLASRPMVGLGLISYSLYLWHWPLFAWRAATSIGDAELKTIMMLLVAALLLAVASYRYVETPFRRFRGAPVAVVSASALLLVVSAAFAMQASRLPELNDPFPLATRAEGDRPDRRCHSMGMEPVETKCRPTAATKWVIWGDSMAFAWTPAAWKLDPAAAVFTRDACGPYLHYLPQQHFRADLACRDYVDRVLAGIPRGSNVILVALWEPKDAKFRALDETLAKLAPVAGRVLILGPTPRMKKPVPQCIRTGLVEECGLGRSEFSLHAQPMLDRLRQAAKPYSNVRVIDLTDDFCGPSECLPIKAGVPLYWDTHHISATKSSSFDVAALLDSPTKE